MKNKGVQLIISLTEQLEKLPHRDKSQLDALKRRSEMIIRNVFGETSKYLTDLRRVRFEPQVYPTTELRYEQKWASGSEELKNLFQTMLEELSIFDEEETTASIDPHKSRKSGGRKAFVVHGHNDAIKNEVARFLEKINIQPIILHERPNSGKTIIEKFEHESSDVSFAVVLLTADDVGIKKGSSESLKDRARQNVILELGYFLGALGRSRVAALVEDGVEIPSDYSGVVYIQLANAEAWKIQLAKELKTAGIDVDMNQVI